MTGHIQKRGKKSWRVKYELPRDETGERRIAYKTVQGKRADAERELRAILYRQDKGIAVDPSKLTVANYLDDWLENVAPQKVAPKALERYRGLVKYQVKPHLGEIRLQKLRPADVAAWHQNLLAAGNLSTRSIHHAHGVLRTALSHAAKVEIVARNVAVIIRPPAPKGKKPRILTADETADTLSKLEGHSLYPMIALALGTGARRGEIAALRWSDIDLDGATVCIERALEQTKEGLRVKEPKTEAGYRTLSLPTFAVEALRDHRRQQLELRMALGVGAMPTEAPVFGDIDGNWPIPSVISGHWRRAVTNRKLPNVTFHALRHTHASALIDAGQNVVAVSRRLGHASPALTLNVYAHLFKNNDKDAAEAIEAAFAK
ncbi:MAG: site-specific integrase [Alphaproteobacteria bacterium]|nr:site-specific integrase [Alphaproteobacteria bacterium]